MWGTLLVTAALIDSSCQKIFVVHQNGRHKVQQLVNFSTFSMQIKYIWELRHTFIIDEKVAWFYMLVAMCHLKLECSRLSALWCTGDMFRVYPTHHPMSHGRTLQHFKGYVNVPLPLSQKWNSFDTTLNCCNMTTVTTMQNSFALCKRGYWYNKWMVGMCLFHCVSRTTILDLKCNKECLAFYFV